MVATKEQRRTPKLLKIRQLLSRFCPIPRLQSATHAGIAKEESTLCWEEKHQEAFDSVKQALSDATTLAAPNEQGRFVLDTDASTVAIAGILHQEQEYNGKTILRPIVYGSKSLTKTQLNYGAPSWKCMQCFTS